MTETFAVSNDIIHHIRRIGSDADATYCGITLAKQLPRAQVSFKSGFPTSPAGYPCQQCFSGFDKRPKSK